MDPFLKQSLHFSHQKEKKEALTLKPLMFFLLFLFQATTTMTETSILNTLCTSTVFMCLSLLSLLQLSLSSPSIHDLLRSKGLPPGLLPEEVKSYNFHQNGHLEVFLDAPCLTKYENRVLFEQVVTANLTYGSLIGVKGLQQEELFVWLPVKDIIVNDPSSGLILFDIGLAYKQLSLSLFEDPPHCRPQGGLKNHVRKEKGFEALR